MPYAVLEQKLRMVPEQDFDFVSHYLDLVLINSKKREEEARESERKGKYLAMLDRSFEQLDKGDVIVKSMSELRAMENS